MTPVLSGVIGALLLFCFYVQRNKDRQIEVLLKDQAVERGGWNLERTALISANDEERKQWTVERRDLNNRIQVPQAAPFMDVNVEKPQHVPFDDDEAFAEAEKEAMAQWP
jgi:hypothetical protein